jgi:transcriptional regulator with XRE-family HTH domain
LGSAHFALNTHCLYPPGVLTISCNPSLPGKSPCYLRQRRKPTKTTLGTLSVEFSRVNKMSDENQATTPLKLKEWRKYRKLNQEEVAKFLDVAQATISRWENGEAPPNYNDLENLARIYNAGVSDLIMRDPFNPDPAAVAYLELKRASEDVQKKALKLITAFLNDAE